MGESPYQAVTQSVGRGNAPTTATSGQEKGVHMFTGSRSFFRIFGCVSLIGVAFLHTHAQQRSLLQGKVLDQTQARVPGAQVTVVAEGQTSGPSATSDEQG